MKKKLFILTSAINTDFGSKELIRFNSTLNTINSIIAKYPEADIWLCDTGKAPISPQWKKHIPEKVRLIEYSLDVDVQTILIQSDVFRQMAEIKYLPGKADNRTPQEFAKYLQAGYIKNRTEITFFGKTLSNNIEEIKKYDRIFKLSGRYTLSPTFDMSSHDIPGKIVTYKPIKSLQKPILDDYPQMENMIPCFLWSFDGKIADEVNNLVLESEAWITSRLNKGNLADIEHALEYNRVAGGYEEYFETVEELGVFTNVNEKSQIYI